MKTPDKIYIAEHNIGFNDIVDMMWTYDKRSDPSISNVEYIRKDTLLNIIKEQKNIAMGFSYEHLKMIEDKINSL